MTAPLVRPDVDRQLKRLKDFQRDTVEHVFARLYGSQEASRRFLVADEVGLGKTMVAGGLISKVVDHLWDSERIDIVYVCSNTGIARQNINRLNVAGAQDASPARITLLPKLTNGLANRKLNLISLTPQTSFDLQSQLGRAEERALLYWMLPDSWRADRETGAQNVLQGSAEREGFRSRVKDTRLIALDATLRADFHARLADRNELRTRFDDLCERFRLSRPSPPEPDRLLQRHVVGDLRHQLAITCMAALKPDLIILDEFQRFKHLLDGTDKAGELARGFFASDQTRVLLLSATPYKMYTKSSDQDGDDHYQDFLQTLRFLAGDDGPEIERIRGLLSGLRSQIVRATPDSAARLGRSKDDLQQALRQYVVRTERLASTTDRNGMLTDVPPSTLKLEARDVRAYLTMEKVATALQQHSVVEHWKSAPYLLNFMDDYELKRDFTSRGGATATVLAAALADGTEALLPWDAIEQYGAVDPGNARLRSLAADTLGQGTWQLLWLPPALPYYRLGRPFDGPQAALLTKRLVFSSWHVVPKVVAALLSYESERLMFGPPVAGEIRANTPEARAKHRPLLRFSRSDDRLTGLPLLTLLYPAVSLAEHVDPLATLRCETPGNELMLPEAVLDQATTTIAAMLEGLPTSDGTGPADERWYWAGSILLDLQLHPESTRRWFAQRGLPALWQGEKAGTAQAEIEETSTEYEGAHLWDEHVEEARKLLDGRVHLGTRPHDLARVLALIALGGPATLALRALSRIAGGRAQLDRVLLRNHAGQIAWGFRSLFNLPEVTAMLRSRQDEERYWRRVLDYCVSGCLQSVLDEYAHVLVEWESVANKTAPERAEVIATRMTEVLQLRTATMTVDAISVAGQPRKIAVEQKKMRARFAARFTASQADDGAGALRLDEVRKAFNSPFWPFVLCSTSVGQEGLDFHLYCHAVVHWNLPSNPVDLEQREGRVHRYKGHAVRKNLASLQRGALAETTAADPWAQMFARENAHKRPGTSDLFPFWVLPTPGGAQIERHIPALPLSRDAARARRLRGDIAVYRLAFGQARQEDLVQFLTDNFQGCDIDHLSQRLLIDLSPPRWVGAVAKANDAVAEPEDDDGWDAEVPETSSAALSTADLKVLLDLYRAVAAAMPIPSAAPYRRLLDEYVRIARR